MRYIRVREKAYIAGIVDGEGCISITRRKIKSKRSNNWFYQTQVIVVNTDKRLIDFLVSLYGGFVTSPRREKAGHKPIYRWVITGNDMRQLLEDTLDYLILKREQARLALSFPSYRHSGQSGRTEIELRDQEGKYLSMRKLNNKGSVDSQITPQTIGDLRESSYRVRAGR